MTEPSPAIQAEAERLPNGRFKPKLSSLSLSEYIKQNSAEIIACMDRFTSIDPESGCWNWTGRVSSNGYGSFSIRLNGKNISKKPHRLTYELLVGPVEPKLVMDHLCRNRKCRNPAHLEPVTAQENIIRGHAARGPRTHCKLGHELSGANVLIGTRGARLCRLCKKAANTKRRGRHRGSVRVLQGEIDQLHDRIKVLEAALKPFVKIADERPDMRLDAFMSVPMIICRNARTALNPPASTGGQGDAG